MTHVVREPSTKSFGGQSVIAVFDDWTSLQAVLEDFAGEKERGATSVLYSPRAIAPPTGRSRFLEEAVELHFAAARQRICCTTGDVAQGLGEKLASGAKSLSDALRSWLHSDQAWQLESHIEKGRFVLWLQPSTSDQFGAVCGRLVKASRHLVAVCNMYSDHE